MSKFSTLLIANRGEIALRVMRTARALGIRTVAVYSEADADAPHAKFADDAVCIGPPPVGESYLSAEKILDAASATGAGAIHPGYGFLSENAGFARAAAEAGIVFVGPPADAVDLMGDKARAKRRMLDAGVPCVPGYQDEDQSEAKFIAAAEEIGFPVMVKAAAGGGGRGMRLVDSAADLPAAIGLARSEAENAFGSGELILEKAIIRPRHVEIQVFGDTHGNVIHLGERDCSVQRRHQKVIEEAPCPVMTPALRAEMGKAAVEAAKAVDYVGAGTVEFLLDDSGSFYFLEMNTRLQVEHPVTEMVTGLDLVALQLRVAQGEPLGIAQEDVSLNGHAVEVRLYAEDPDADFLPSTGHIDLWHRPAGEGVRVDDGVETGGEVSPFYDPMLAKVIAFGDTRDEARRRLIASLEGSALFGPATNRDFLIDALSRPDFADGKATTAFIEETYGEGGYASEPAPPAAHAAAAALLYELSRRDAIGTAVGVAPELLDWSSVGSLNAVAAFDADGETALYQIARSADGTCRIACGNEAFTVTAELDGSLASDAAQVAGTATITIDGRRHDAIYHRAGTRALALALGGRSYTFRDIAGEEGAGDEDGSGGTVTAPMHGLLLELSVSEGDSVEKGEKLGVLEAMKMQHEIAAVVTGKVTSVAATAGAQIGAGDLILVIEPAEAG